MVLLLASNLRKPLGLILFSFAARNPYPRDRPLSRKFVPPLPFLLLLFISIYRTEQLVDCPKM